MTPDARNLPPSNRAYRGTILHSLSRDELAFFPDGGLLVNADGRVVACEHWAKLEASNALAGFEVAQMPSGALIVPGFVDTHVHLPQMAVAGCQEENLLSWLETHIFAEESRFEDDAYARQISEWFFSELLANGTTLSAVFLTSHQSASRIAFETAEKLGNRVVMGQNLMDLNAPKALLKPAAQLLAETEELCEVWHGRDEGRLRYAWIPRFAITSTEELLQGIGQLRRKHPEVYLHTHLSEQIPEIEAVKAQFPWAKDYTEVYEHFGLLGSRTILAHAIHLSDEELSRLKALDASLAHCPSSNFFLKSGRFRLIDVLNLQLRLGLGSDVGAGPELSLLKVMKDAQFMQADTLVPLKALFYLATLGGAEALDQHDRVGNFEIGKEADFVLLTPQAKPAFMHHALLRDEASSNPEALLSGLIYLGDQRLVSATFIRGREIYRKA